MIDIIKGCTDSLKITTQHLFYLLDRGPFNYRIQARYMPWFNKICLLVKNSKSRYSC